MQDQSLALAKMIDEQIEQDIEKSQASISAFTEH
jgi:hypothetical protein